MKKLAVLGLLGMAVVALVVLGRRPTTPGWQPVTRMPTSTPPAETAPVRAAPAAPDVPREKPPLPASATAKTDGGAGGPVTVVRGRWGSGAGEFGRKHEPESNPEAPMAIAAGAHGELAIVDQVNRRVLRYHDGKPTGTLAMGGDTVQDLALGEGGQTVLLDRLADRNVQLYDASGKLLNEAPLVGKGVPEGGGVTGVFAERDGIWVEREHGALVRVADAAGNSDGERPELWGRPSRDGRLLLRAAIADRASGAVAVDAVDRASGARAFSQVVRLGAPILHILLLDSDRRGRVYIGVDTGRESSEPPYPIVDEAITVVRLGAGGVEEARAALPPLPGSDESFRPLAVDDAGAVYEMLAGEGGLAVLRFELP